MHLWKNIGLIRYDISYVHASPIKLLATEGSGFCIPFLILYIIIVREKMFDLYFLSKKNIRRRIKIVENFNINNQIFRYISYFVKI